ncbi:hypothetical protein FBU30_008085 [Linnemannia zychae]|nr:hypothetical protein FBU30_008085 [Linnemannia zychae]
MRRSRRFLLAFPILIGLFLTLSLQPLNLVDLGTFIKDRDAYESNSTLDIKDFAAPFDRDWKGDTAPHKLDIPDATWTCTDDDQPASQRDSKSNRRSRQCIVQNICVDRKGAFIRSSQWPPREMPDVNLIASLEDTDDYYRPRVERTIHRAITAHYVNETLFIHGFFWHNHFSHWLYNGMMPLYSTVKRFKGTRNSWTFRPKSWYNDYNPKNQGNWEMRHIFQTGHELVLLKDEVVTEFQMLPPSNAPICFRQAVIGLGSQCALGYCEQNIPSDIYGSFRDEVADYYWRTPQMWENHISTVRERDVSITDSKLGSPLKCLELARYYNFEPSTGADPLEAMTESVDRIGQLYPDKVDPEVDRSPDGKKRLVVAMIQREGSRRVINDQDLVDGLAAAGFRVKWITFDHGCGVPETAYLLRDVNVLVSPHGNAIGTSIFMQYTDPVPTLISLDASRYSEAWFINTATVIGLRFLMATCGPHQYVDNVAKEKCPYYKDTDRAHKALSIWGTRIVLGLSDELARSYRELAANDKLTEKELQRFRDYVKRTPSAQQLASEEFDQLIGPETPEALLHKYDEIITTYFLEVFWRDVARYANVERVVALIKDLQKDQEQEQAIALATASYISRPKYQQYLDYLREGKACGVKYCESVLPRNVYSSSSRAMGIHSIDDPERWGQPAVNNSIFEGLDNNLNWRPAALFN